MKRLACFSSRSFHFSLPWEVEFKIFSDKLYFFQKIDPHQKIRSKIKISVRVFCAQPVGFERRNRPSMQIYNVFAYKMQPLKNSLKSSKNLNFIGFESFFTKIDPALRNFGKKSKFYARVFWVKSIVLNVKAPQEADIKCFCLWKRKYGRLKYVVA